MFTDVTDVVVWLPVCTRATEVFESGHFVILELQPLYTKALNCTASMAECSLAHVIAIAFVFFEKPFEFVCRTSQLISQLLGSLLLCR
jgi:hypothetical protein